MKTNILGCLIAFCSLIALFVYGQSFMLWANIAPATIETIAFIAPFSSPTNAQDSLPPIVSTYKTYPEIKATKESVRYICVKELEDLYDQHKKLFVDTVWIYDQDQDDMYIHIKYSYYNFSHTDTSRIRSCGKPIAVPIYLDLDANYPLSEVYESGGSNRLEIMVANKTIKYNRTVSYDFVLIRDGNEFGIPCGADKMPPLKNCNLASLIDGAAVGCNGREQVGHAHIRAAIDCYTFLRYKISATNNPPKHHKTPYLDDIWLPSGNYFIDIYYKGYRIFTQYPVTIPKTMHRVINAQLTGIPSIATHPDYCNGSMHLTMVGGTRHHGFQWSNETADHYFNGNKLCPGVYTLTITDEFWCQTTVSAEVTLAPDSPCTCQAFMQSEYYTFQFTDTIKVEFSLRNIGTCPLGTKTPVRVELLDINTKKNYLTLLEDSLMLDQQYFFNFYKPHYDTIPAASYYLKITACTQYPIDYGIYKPE
ncbi:MAG: hypothetical protein JNM36_02045 [Chitinophagales bacterium]|nr:hypothetical protein [Chitinophagales bacterium]